MKADVRLTGCIITLLAVFSILSCKHPTEPGGGKRMVDVEVKGNRPFHYEGTWDDYNQKLDVDSSQYREWSGFIQWGAIGYTAQGSYFRVYAKSLDTAGYVSVGVYMHTGSTEGHDVISWFSDSKESWGGAVEIICIVP